MDLTHRYTAAGDRPVHLQRLPAWLFYLFFAVFLAFGAGSQPLAAAGSLLVLLLIISLMWRPGEPPVLAYIFVIQWLEASIGFFDFAVPEVGLAGIGRVEHDTAAVLMLLALLVQAIGVRIAIGKAGTAGAIIQAQAQRVPQERWVRLYIVSVGVAVGATVLAELTPPLSQPLLSLAQLKWAAYVALTCVTFARRDASKGVWLVIFVFELLSSLGGYFSSFKFVFIFTLIGIAASKVRFRPRVYGLLVVVAAIALFLGVVWSAVKVEYRYSISAGRETQAVVGDLSDRLEKLADLVTSLTADDLRDGYEQLIRRIEYLEYFADVVGFVPDAEPHTHGALWLDAVLRPVTPRLLFPEKAEIDESELTRRFTGRQIAGAAEGTQISIGYIGESYIDFGRLGMMGIMFAVGIVIGLTYRWLTHIAASRGVVGVGLAAALFVLSAGTVGNSSAKLVGGVASTVLVIWLFNRYILPRYLAWTRA